MNKLTDEPQNWYCMTVGCMYVIPHTKMQTLKFDVCCPKCGASLSNFVLELPRKAIDSLTIRAQRYYNELPSHGKQRKGSFYIKELLAENKALRHDIEKAVQTSSELATEKSKLEAKVKEQADEIAELKLLLTQVETYFNTYHGLPNNGLLRKCITEALEDK